MLLIYVCLIFWMFILEIFVDAMRFLGGVFGISVFAGIQRLKVVRFSFEDA